MNEWSVSLEQYMNFTRLDELYQSIKTDSQKVQPKLFPIQNNSPGSYFTLLGL